MSDVKGVIFDISRFTVHDGDGLRSTVFVKGCPLRCPWCQNPEGRHKAIDVMWFPTLCIGCGRCEKACKYDALHISDGKVQIDKQKCTLCGKCVEGCPPLALKMNGYEITDDEVIEELLKDSVFYNNSGGGITLSGGEPLSQKDFCLSLLSKCKTHGLGTAMETCLYAREEDVLDFLGVTDQFIADIKIFDEKKHKQVTGKSNRMILKNAANLIERRVNMLVRIPLIPGYTDDDDNIAQIARFVASFGSGIKLELLNYNPLAADKFLTINEPYLVGKEAKPLPPHEMERKKALVNNILEGKE